MEAAAAAGIDLIPSNDFSYYDQMLDTAILLNVIPQRYQRLAFENPEETLFAMGRGYQGEKGDVTALPMKKWFTTNYHYLVPEIDSATDIKLNSTKPFDEFNEAKALGITTKPVLIGPYTFFKLARNPQAEELEYDKGLVNASPPSTPRSWPSSPSWAPNGSRSTNRTSCSTRSRATSNCSRACTPRSCPHATARSRCCSTPTSATSRRV